MYYILHYICLQGETDAARAMMSSLQAERKIFLDERQSIIAEREAMKSQQDTIKNNEKNIRSDLKFKDLESCEKAIKDLGERINGK